DCLSSVLNVDLDGPQWLQATLPVRDDGLGIRRAEQLAPSAFLASAASSNLLITSKLPASVASVGDRWVGVAEQEWRKISGVEPSAVTQNHSQRGWDALVVTEAKRMLTLSFTDSLSRARFLAVTAPHAGDWLHAPPLTAVGLRMSDEEIRMAAGLRLGTTL